MPSLHLDTSCDTATGKFVLLERALRIGERPPVGKIARSLMPSTQLHTSCDTATERSETCVSRRGTPVDKIARSLMPTTHLHSSCDTPTRRSVLL
ncbi:hypothetical protein MPTK2_1g90240P [Marchantia polymorpha subsp. ruderalis]